MNPHLSNPSSIPHTAVFKPGSQEELANAIGECVQVDNDCATGPKGPIGSWDVSRVTAMWSVFDDQKLFNGDISKWDVSKVTSMYSMFKSAQSFNQDISKWDVSSVTGMHSTFKGALLFNQDISNWDVSRVVSMYSMFEGALFFNQDISQWDVFSVLNMDLMFHGASSFHQTLCSAAWRVSKKARTDDMFADSNGRIGDDNACSTTAPPTRFEPIFKHELTNAIGECVTRWDMVSDGS